MRQALATGLRSGTPTAVSTKERCSRHRRRCGQWLGLSAGELRRYEQASAVFLSTVLAQDHFYSASLSLHATI